MIDPTCGSGSLLLRVAKQKDVKVSSFYGQEKIRKIIQKNHDEYDKKINKANTVNNKILTSRKNLINAIKTIL